MQLQLKKESTQRYLPRHPLSDHRHVLLLQQAYLQVSLLWCETWNLFLLFQHWQLLFNDLSSPFRPVWILNLWAPANMPWLWGCDTLEKGWKGNVNGNCWSEPQKSATEMSQYMPALFQDTDTWRPTTHPPGKSQRSCKRFLKVFQRRSSQHPDLERLRCMRCQWCSPPRLTCDAMSRCRSWLLFCCCSLEVFEIKRPRASTGGSSLTGWNLHISHLCRQFNVSIIYSLIFTIASVAPCGFSCWRFKVRTFTT